jgi:phytoene dehydrogenase-like protein
MVAPLKLVYAFPPKSCAILDYPPYANSGARVTEIITIDGKATGVKTSDGTVYEATKIIANVNPALIPNLLPKVEAEKPEVSKVKNFRPGLGTMMIHLALSDLPDWKASEARGFNYVHIAPYVDDLAMTYTVAAAGKLPTTPALVIGQPTVSDPSRAPEGKHVLWIQVRVLPLEISGTTWDQVGEEYADQIIENIEQ